MLSVRTETPEGGVIVRVGACFALGLAAVKAANVSKQKDVLQILLPAVLSGRNQFRFRSVGIKFALVSLRLMYVCDQCS